MVELSRDLFAAGLAVTACTAGSCNDIAVLALTKDLAAAVLADLNVTAIHRIDRDALCFNGLALFVLLVVVQAVLAVLKLRDDVFVTGCLVKFAATGAEAGVIGVILIVLSEGACHFSILLNAEVTLHCIEISSFREIFILLADDDFRLAVNAEGVPAMAEFFGFGLLNVAADCALLDIGTGIFAGSSNIAVSRLGGSLVGVLDCFDVVLRGAAGIDHDVHGAVLVLALVSIDGIAFCVNEGSIDLADVLRRSRNSRTLPLVAGSLCADLGINVVAAFAGALALDHAVGGAVCNGNGRPTVSLHGFNGCITESGEIDPFEGIFCIGVRCELVPQSGMFSGILRTGIAIAAEGALKDLIAVGGAGSLVGFGDIILVGEFGSPVILFLGTADGASEDGPAFGLTGSGIDFGLLPGVLPGRGDDVYIDVAAFGANESLRAGLIAGSVGRLVLIELILMDVFLTGGEHQSGGSEQKQGDQSNQELQKLSG